LSPDVVNLHWLGRNFLSLNSIERIKQPIVLTLHDSWYLTGGCFVPGNCLAYRCRCFDCPLESGNKNGQAEIAAAHRQKRRIFEQKNVVIVSPSRWLADAVRESAVTSSLRVNIIPNGVDTKLYRPQARQLARQLFGLPENGFLLLFGSAGGTTDPNKGFDLLCDALSAPGLPLPASLQVIVFGAACGEHQCPVPVHFVGPVYDERALCALYNAVNAVVVPSRQESFSLVTIEAMACGTPVVAFGNSGPGEIIRDGECGWISPVTSAPGLAEALARCFADPEPVRTSALCRKRILADYEISSVAERYAGLYHEVALPAH
jgi:glycosyltransferase involved in cell wall biosynthesis